MKTFFNPALLALTAAFAAAVPFTAHAENYVGLSVGKSEQKLSAGEFKFDKRDTAWKVYGGHKFNETFGVEAGFVSHGEVRRTIAAGEWNSDASTVYVAATATLPLAGGFSLTGKLGIADNRQKYGSGGWESPTSVTTKAMAGVGASYKFTPTVSGVVEYEHFGKVYNYYGTSIKANTLSLGVRKSF